MKLTLRTLLAYLDDRLSPANARELGQKLAKSPFATELADRIKDVVRRRRLASESAEHKTIDGNLIAEYLDDQLTPELVALIEKEILSSDHSLAEVASTHQILGLLSDPVELDNGLKHRLYKLDPAVATETADGGTDSPDAVQPAKAADWTPLQKQTESQKRSPMLLLAVMVLGWLGLLATDSNLFKNRNQQIAATDIEAGDEKAGDEEQADPVDVGADAKPADVAVKQPGTNDDTTVAQADDSSAAPNTGIATDSTAAGNAAAGTVGTSEPMTPSAAVTAVDSAAPNTPLPAPDVATSTDTQKPPVTGSPDTSKPVTPAAPAARFELVDGDGMVALLDPEQSTWIRASSLGVAPTASWTKELSSTFAAVAEPFSARVVAPNSGWSVQLLGPSAFQTVAEPKAAISVVEGRLLLRRYARDDAATLMMLAGRRTVEIAVPEVDDVVGIEVILQPASKLGVEPDADQALPPFPVDNNRVIRISAADGDVQIVVDGNERSVTIPRGSEWIWNTTSDIATAGAVSVNGAIPEWLFAARNPPIELQAGLIAETVAAYPQSESVSGAAMTLSDHKNPQIAEYGVRQLALLRSVNDLTTIMLQTNEDPTRQAAIAGLQRLIRQSPTDAQRVLAALETRLPRMELDNAMTLLQGVTRSGAEDPATCEFLLSMLEHNRVALRAMAIFNLERLTNERHGFFASDDSGRRDAAIRRWRRQLERNDGRLISPTE